LPATATQILSALLVALSIASLMDDNNFCLDDNPSHMRSVVSEVPDWIRLIPLEKTRAACHDLAVDLWGCIFKSPTNPTPTGTSDSNDDCVEDFFKLFDLRLDMERLTAEKELTNAPQTSDGGAFEKTRQTVQDFCLFQEDPLLPSLSQDTLPNFVYDQEMTPFDSPPVIINIDFMEKETPMNIFSQTTRIDAPSTKYPYVDPLSPIVSGAVCVIFILFLGKHAPTC
jgi:hypothetical protein